MQQLFDEPWEELSVESVERFLADVDDEGLLWEAKGTKVPHRDSIRKEVCGFANAVGGYLIIGAEQGANGWTLPGITFPHAEPATWVSSLIVDGGVSPLPVFDAKPFGRDEGRKAVVVKVEPVAVPPCITASGLVFQRVTGQTPPVTDQRVLADLIEKGTAARTRAEAFALQAARRLLAEPMGFGPAASVFAVALCATGGPEDKSAVLFDETRALRFEKLASEQLQPDSLDQYGVQSAIRQDSLLAWSISKDRTSGTTAAAFWDGSVAVVCSHNGNDYLVPTLTGDVRRFWRGLAAAVQLFGGVSEAHLAIALKTSHAALHRPGREVPRTDVRRWTEARQPSEEELDGAVRELERGFGRRSWERRRST
jgi:hypothetical protein